MHYTSFYQWTSHPEWTSSSDVDVQRPLDTRRSFLERFDGSGALVIGTHFAGPTVGSIVRDGNAFRFEV